MKTIHTYILEKFQVGKDNIKKYAYHPKDKDELIKCIKDKIEKEELGTEDKPLDLNDIDTSEITDMSDLFNAKNGDLIELSDNGYFDISAWDVSNVENMSYMFCWSSFNGDISEWDVSNVKSMKKMFMYSDFNGNLSKWDVSKVEDMYWMFRRTKFNGNISSWDVSKVKNMSGMFYDSNFNRNLSKWNVSNVEDMSGMFTGCLIENNPPKWYHE